jgi:tetratricopeptide (TPR) repeat protein
MLRLPRVLQRSLLTLTLGGLIALAAGYPFFADYRPLYAQGGSVVTLPPSHKLDINRLRHEYQRWNNCGPTTLTMGLSYFGYPDNQLPAAYYLKPNTEDKNVNPWEMVSFVNEVASQTTNVRALYRPGGDFDLIKQLLVADFPVIIEKGFEPPDEDWMGHYLLLIGYNDGEGVLFTYDSYMGHGDFQGLREPYAKIERYWWHFNNTFIVLYPSERETEVLQILGERADLNRAYELAAVAAQIRAQADAQDAWAWFNIGDALTHLGYYQQATDFFNAAFDIGLPWRTLWYRHTPLEAFYQSGKFNTVLYLVQQAKLTTPYVEEWHYYHGLVFASHGRVADAKAQFNQALTYNSNFQPARDAIAALDAGTFQPVAQTDAQ